MIKYLGSKRTLLPDITEIARKSGLITALDLFSGTSRVGHALKAAGMQVFSNDLNEYAHCLATCYVEADLENVQHEATLLVEEFNKLPPDPGYFTKTFCEDSRFFQPKNGARVDAIREAIESKGLDPTLKAVLLVSLMEAADRVDSTCGVQMAYLKKWAARSNNDLNLRLPNVLPASVGPCKAYNLDADIASQMISADLVYLDPPYNQHSYLGNYHIWESLVKWDKPDVYGIACKRVDCRTRKSDYNSKPKHKTAFEGVLTMLCNNLTTSLIVVSFSNEGYQTREDMEALLSRFGTTSVITKDYKRYVGAQIGYHNPSGEKVGEVSHLRNEEYLYLLRPYNAPKQVVL